MTMLPDAKPLSLAGMLCLTLCQCRTMPSEVMERMPIGSELSDVKEELERIARVTVAYDGPASASAEALTTVGGPRLEETLETMRTLFPQSRIVILDATKPVFHYERFVLAVNDDGRVLAKVFLRLTL